MLENMYTILWDKSCPHVSFEPGIVLGYSDVHDGEKLF